MLKWTFLGSIELIINPKPISYWLEFCKKVFEPETEP